VSDRDPRSTAKFWQTFWKSIGTNLAMSSAYHPQTDGRTERANRTLEQMLRFYVNRQLSDWDELLLCCGFAYNNSEQASTGYTPFFLNCGLHLLTSISLELPADILVQETKDRLANLAKARQEVKEAIAESQRRQKHFADESRRDVTFAVGQKSLLKLKGGPQQKGPAQKLRPERAGPFKITKVNQQGSTMQLGMSRMSWKGLDIFHVSQLTPYNDGVNMFPSRTPESVQPCDIAHLDAWEAEDVEYAVNELKASRVNTATQLTEWLVSWKGYAEDANLWIQDSQMNDLLRVEAKDRSQELMEEGKRLATLERNMQIHRTHALSRRGRKKRAT
jgi:hypothetical protein